MTRLTACNAPLRLSLALGLAGLLAACDEPLDFDLRGKVGAFSTAPAAQQAVASRPAPDSRGVISYPNYQVAVARRGDTLADVALRTGQSADEVARFNGLKPTDKLREGEIIALPRRVSTDNVVGGAGSVDIAALAGSAIDAAPDTAGVSTTALPPAAAPAAAARPEPVRHKVVRGETAYTVARLYGVPVKSLAEWNGLGADFAIREGQHLLIPTPGAPAPTRTAAAGATVVPQPGSGSPTPMPPSASQPLPAEQIAPRGTAEVPVVSVGQPSRAAAPQARLAYPVEGKIVRAYAKGRNEGIDLAAAPGTPVKAAADGSVAAITASSGERLPIVVVRHADNLLTVYANVDDIAVKKGDTVKRGQTLARLRGGDGAYLHFEVRNGFDSVDPETYLN